MRKQIMKTQSTDPKTHAPRLLSSSELEQVTGGEEVMKSRHEMSMSVIGNLR